MRSVLITGASSDIGLATARRYLSEGWRVIGHYRNERPELTALLQEFPAIELWQQDFTDPAALDKELRQQADRLKSVDAMINLAAAMPNCSFAEADAAQIMAVIGSNLLPGLLLMQLLGPAMAERGWGRIVHASSIGVKFGGGGSSFLYSLSKHAQEFIPSAARNWAKDGVFVNVLRVGVTNTRGHANFPAKNLNERIALIPAKRMASASEIAEALFWLGSDCNGYISAQVIDASGGE